MKTIPGPLPSQETAPLVRCVRRAAVISNSLCVIPCWSLTYCVCVRSRGGLRLAVRTPAVSVAVAV